MRSVAIPGEVTRDIGRAYRPIVAERELHGQRLLDAVDVLHAKVDQRRRVQVDDDEIGVTARFDGTDALAQIQRFRCTARGEIGRASCRERV